MTAASIASPGGALFSPITLFECTISNAQMLVESMELCDLVLALKIVSQLHGRVVEIMEPSAGRAQRLADLYSRHADRIERLAEDQRRRHRQRLEEDDDDEDEEEEEDEDEELLAAEELPRTPENDDEAEKNSISADEELEAPAGKREIVSIDFEEDEEDLRALELDEASNCGRRSQAPKESATKGLSDNWKLLLRKSYRILKAEGRPMFDFTKSYSAPVNLKAAEAIINKALAMSNKPLPDVNSWKTLFIRYVEQWYRKTLKPTYTKMANKAQLLADKKLSRRQRSFENLLTQSALTGTERTRIQAILSKDYTSSDEEDADGGLYVRRLTWETEEATRLKAVLDRHFSEVIANPKERLDLLRMHRDAGCTSERQPPASGADWAVDWARALQRDTGS